jgi:NADH-quinone oxidoreductase subunit I
MRVVDRAEPKGAQQFYLVAVVQGLFLTMGHVVKNIFNPKRMPVVFYPEQKKALPPATRGRHRLMKREDGAPRCTACMLCATACPAECIHIKAEESPDPDIEKLPERFEIDMLRCVFCGFCVDACPLDAIRMDVPEVTIAGYTRESLVYTKEFLMNHNNEDVVADYNPPRPVTLTHGPHARP